MRVVPYFQDRGASRGGAGFEEYDFWISGVGSWGYAIENIYCRFMTGFLTFLHVEGNQGVVLSVDSGTQVGPPGFQYPEDTEKTLSFPRVTHSDGGAIAI